MIKEKIKQMQMIISNKEGNNKRKIENLVVFIVILIITIIIINMIWKDNKKESDIKNDLSEDIVLAKEELTVKSSNKNELEERLENILSKIEGVGVAKVMITYSETSQTMAMYNEDSKISDTEEQASGGGTRKISETNSKKEVIYKEVNGEKIPVTQSIISPKVEGAIITATGAKSAVVKTNIIQAVEAVTGLPTHKIQVFEMKSY